MGVKGTDMLPVLAGPTELQDKCIVMLVQSQFDAKHEVLRSILRKKLHGPGS